MNIYISLLLVTTVIASSFTDHVIEKVPLKGFGEMASGGYYINNNHTTSLYVASNQQSARIYYPLFLSIIDTKTTDMLNFYINIEQPCSPERNYYTEIDNYSTTAIDRDCATLLKNNLDGYRYCITIIHTVNTDSDYSYYTTTNLQSNVNIDIASFDSQQQSYFYTLSWKFNVGYFDSLNLVAIIISATESNNQPIIIHNGTIDYVRYIPATNSTQSANHIMSEKINIGYIIASSFVIVILLLYVAYTFYQRRTTKANFGPEHQSLYTAEELMLEDSLSL